MFWTRKTLSHQQGETAPYKPASIGKSGAKVKPAGSERSAGLWKIHSLPVRLSAPQRDRSIHAAGAARGKEPQEVHATSVAGAGALESRDGIAISLVLAAWAQAKAIAAEAPWPRRL
jgi:hypothetical protein